jgi:hypothetical protein
MLGCSCCLTDSAVRKYKNKFVCFKGNMTLNILMGLSEKGICLRHFDFRCHCEKEGGGTVKGSQTVVASWDPFV